MAVGLWGAGLPQGLASAQGEPPTPPATETFTTHLRFESLLDVPRLPPEKEPSIEDSASGHAGAGGRALEPAGLPVAAQPTGLGSLPRASGDGADQVNLSDDDDADMGHG